VTAGAACTVAVAGMADGIVTAGGTVGAVGTAGGDFQPRDLEGGISALRQKQTCAVQLGMSALGQKQTSYKN